MVEFGVDTDDFLVFWCLADGFGALVCVLCG